jgi:hypothetical protein
MANLAGGSTHELTMIKVRFIVIIDGFVEFIIRIPCLISFRALSIGNKKMVSF